MKFTTLPQTTHEQVLIRPIEAEDIAPWRAYLLQPEVYQNTSWNFPSHADLEKYIWSGEHAVDQSYLRFAIASCADNQLVGTIGFHTIHDVNRSAELTYDLVPRMWGRGIATKVASDAVSWAHEHAGVIRVQATVLQSNIRSIRLIERLGFEREGLLRSYRMVRGTPGNFWMFGHVRPIP